MELDKFFNGEKARAIAKNATSPRGKKSSLGGELEGKWLTTGEGVSEGTDLTYWGHSRGKKEKIREKKKK